MLTGSNQKVSSRMTFTGYSHTDISAAGGKTEPNLLMLLVRNVVSPYLS